MVVYMDRDKRIWYLSPMQAAKVQASLRIRAVSPEPSLLAHTSSESRGTFRQKARSLAPLNGLACAVKICHDGMLEDTNSLDGAHIIYIESWFSIEWVLNIQEFNNKINKLKKLLPFRNVINWKLGITVTVLTTTHYGSILINPGNSVEESVMIRQD